MFVDVLPRWERYAYWIIGLAGLGYSFLLLYIDGNKFLPDIGTNLADGWRWIGRKQDQTDEEWWRWRGRLWIRIPLYLFRIVYSVTLFHIRVSEKVRLCLLVMFDISAVVFCLGWRPVMFLLCQTAIMYLVTFTGSILFVWLLVMTIIATRTFDFTYVFQTSILGLSGNTEIQYTVSNALLQARLISFAVEKIKWRKQRTNVLDNHSNFTRHFQSGEKPAADVSDLSMHKRNRSDDCDIKYSTKEDHSRDQPSDPQYDPDLLDLIFYSFYLPLFFDGPIIIFNDFHSQIRAHFKSDVSSVDVLDIFKRLMRLAFWAFFIDFQFHFLYFCAMATSVNICNSTSRWTGAAIAYGYGQFFMMKYLCMHGLGLQVSRFDGIIPIPSARCIGWVYSYTDMWKHFDVGLYIFIKHHIYIPLGGSRAGFARQLLASAMAFLFIFWWHGGSLSVFIWCMGNFVTGSLEACVPILERSSLGVKVKSFLSPAMRLRLKAICIVPVYSASCIQIFFFFFDTDVAKAYFERIVTKATWSEVIIQGFFLMACVHNALYVNARRQAKNRKQCSNKIP